MFSSLPATARVLQWHWEEIDVLPPGAVLLATSPAYRHQAFRLGEAAWGVQGHPEVTPEIAAAWAREDSPLLVAAGRRPEDLVAEVEDATGELVATWRPVAAAFAAVVGNEPDPQRSDSRSTAVMARSLSDDAETGGGVGQWIA